MAPIKSDQALPILMALRRNGETRTPALGERILYLPSSVLGSGAGYIIKGIGMKVTMHSKINIFIDPASGKIEKVEDRWKTTFPDATILNVHFKQLVSPGWWLYYVECWVWWAWSFVWWTRLWEVCFYSSSCLISEITAHN
jgi:hypothetical protein